MTARPSDRKDAMTDTSTAFDTLLDEYGDWVADEPTNADWVGGDALTAAADEAAAETNGFRLLDARYPGACAACNGALAVGDRIAHGGRGQALHPACAATGDVAPVGNAARGRSRRGRTPRVTVWRNASGHFVGSQNARGRCEDAPCCGCCSY